MKIYLKNVTYHYPNSALSDYGIEDVSFEISSNKKIVIVGETGSGKSTLLKLIKGLLSPNSGSIEYDGVTQKDLAYLFQYAEHQIFETSIYRDVSFSLRKLKLEEKEMLSRVEKILELLGLDKSFLYRSTLNLSGGEKKRVALAGILINNPDLLLLDEPTVGLDSLGKEQLFKILLNWQAQDKNRSYIFISHDMNDVLEYADEIIVMHEGKLLYHMEVSEFFQNNLDILEEISLELPESIKFLNKLNNKLEQKNQ